MPTARYLERTDLFAKFVVEGVPPSLVNSIRRVIISEIPVLAIDYITVITNTSVMHDEVLAHRLAMIPLTTPIGGMPSIEECETGLADPSECYVRLVLDVEAGGKEVVVYARDLKSNRDDVRPVYPDMPILKLAPGQKVHVEAMARLGRAKEHAKWQAALASYFYYPRVEFRDRKACADVCKSVCPDAFDVDGNGELIVRDLEKCSFGKLDVCKSVCGEAMVLEWDVNKYVFWVESFGNLSVDDVLRLAFTELENKFTRFMMELEKAVAKIKESAYAAESNWANESAAEGSDKVSEEGREGE